MFFLCSSVLPFWGLLPTGMLNSLLNSAAHKALSSLCAMHGISWRGENLLKKGMKGMFYKCGYKATLINLLLSACKDDSVFTILSIHHLCWGLCSFEVGVTCLEVHKQVDGHLFMGNLGSFIYSSFILWLTPPWWVGKMKFKSNSHPMNKLLTQFFP